MWVYKGVELGREVIPGFQPADYDDDEFEEACKHYDEVNGYVDDDAGHVQKSGLWEHTSKKAPKVQEEVTDAPSGNN